MFALVVNIYVWKGHALSISDLDFDPEWKDTHSETVPTLTQDVERRPAQVEHFV